MFQALILGLLGYGAAVSLILFLFALRKWRAGFVLLGAVTMLAIGVPLLSQGWVALKQFRMERREIAGTPAAVVDRHVLLIAQDDRCIGYACAALLHAAAEKGMLVLPGSALLGMDLSQPLDLRRLPIERWVSNYSLWDGVTVKPASGEDFGAIDYVVLTRQPDYRVSVLPVLPDLSVNPALAALGRNQQLFLATAPLDRPGWLDLSALSFDHLDLMLVEEPLGMPLITDNRLRKGNRSPAPDAVAETLCQGIYGPDPDCADAFQ